MFWTIARFETSYQLRNPALWIWAVLSLALTASIFIFEPMRPSFGSSLINTSATAFFPILAAIAIALVFPMTGIMGSAVTRDASLNSGELLKSTLLNRHGYVLGRFFGAFAAILFVYALHVPIIWLAAHLPSLPADKYPPFALIALLQPAMIMAITLLTIAAILFSVGTATRSALVSYILVALLITGSVFAFGKLSKGGFEEVRNAIDWTGVSSVFISNEARSIVDRNTQLLTLSDDFYVNRLVWLGVGLVALIVAWLMQGMRGGLWGNRRIDAASGILAPSVGAFRPYLTTIDAKAVRTQFMARMALDLKRILMTPAFALLLIGGMGLVWLMANNVGQIENRQVQPVTRLLVDQLVLSVPLLILILLGVFSAELVWGDMDRKVHELVDTTPARNWIYFVPKLLVLVIACAIFIIFGGCVGLGAQMHNGGEHFEIGKLAVWWGIPMAIFAIQMSVLALACQCLAPNKFVGWGSYAAVTIGIDVAAELLGLSHPLLGYGFTPDIPLSDFNGQAQFWANAAWLDLHWTLVACVLTILSIMMWRRGSEQRLRPRFAIFKASLNSKGGVALALSVLASFASGGWIFYNNNIVENYRTDGGYERWQAQMERDLVPLEGLPGPTVTALTLNVDIRPKTLRVKAKGTLTLENRTAAPLRQMIVNRSELATISATMNGAQRERTIKDYGIEIWNLTTPLAPGEKRDLSFESTMDGHCIACDDPDTSVVPNGSFIDSYKLVPTTRIDRRDWLEDIDKREKYDLPLKRPVPPNMLEESFYTPGSGFIDADITVSTDAGQTPIAPGLLVSEVKKDGRVTRRYKPPVKISNAFALQSANYLVKRDILQINNRPVIFEIYYLPGFTRNVDYMMDAMKSSLVSLSRRFGEYPFGVMRVVHTPSYGKQDFAAQAFAGTVPFYEDGGWLQIRGTQKFDALFDTIAHETAHMWWGHQVDPSNRRGARLLTESLATMSSWSVGMEMWPELNGAEFDQVWSARDEYLRGRGEEKVGEPTLAMMDSEKYLAYSKGPLVLHLLRDEIGHERFDGILRAFVQRYAFKDRPYPNAQDFIAMLRARSPPQYAEVITQLLENRVEWGSEINSVEVSGDSKIGRTIKVEAAAWAEYQDELGAFVRRVGITQGQIRTESKEPCSAESIAALNLAPGFDRKEVAKDCFSSAPLDAFRADFSDQPRTYIFKSQKEKPPVSVSFGRREFQIGRKGLQNEFNHNGWGGGAAEVTPPPDFLPPRSTQ